MAIRAHGVPASHIKLTNLLTLRGKCIWKKNIVKPKNKPIKAGFFNWLKKFDQNLFSYD